VHASRLRPGGSSEIKRSSIGLAVPLVTTVAAFVLVVSTFWVGFLGSDDTVYWAGADHWALPHTLVNAEAVTRAPPGSGLPALLPARLPSPSRLRQLGRGAPDVTLYRLP
jgi:hypothetical protein